MPRYHWDESKVRKFLSDTAKFRDEAAREGADIVAEAARRNLKKNAPTSTGNLASQVDAYPMKSGDGYIVEAQKKKSGYEWAIGSDAQGRFYGPHLEMGHWSSLWGKYSKKKGNIKQSTVRVASEPFMRPALKKNKKKIRDLFKTKLNARMD